MFSIFQNITVVSFVLVCFWLAWFTDRCSIGIMETQVQTLLFLTLWSWLVSCRYYMQVFQIFGIFFFHNNVQNKNKTIFSKKKKHSFYFTFNCRFFGFFIFLIFFSSLCNVFEWWTTVSLFSMRRQPFDIVLISGDFSSYTRWSKMTSYQNISWRNRFSIT